MVAYERWLLTRGSKDSDLTWKLLVFWKKVAYKIELITRDHHKFDCTQLYHTHITINQSEALSTVPTSCNNNKSRLGKLQNTGLTSIIHQTSWLIWLVSSFVIHCRAKQATKYSRPQTMHNVIEIFPHYFIHVVPNKPLNIDQGLDAV